jgi:hypothetical protein
VLWACRLEVAWHLAASLAHELGHAWLFLHAYPDLTPLVEEGLCELYEYHWLQSQRTPEAAYRRRLMEENDDPVYGEGLRAAQSALQGRTLPALLEFVWKHGRLP